MVDFHDISYLRNGTPRQQLAYQTIQKHQLMERLNNFTPFLAGTIPLHIDIENSDLDIICYFENLSDFKKYIERNFQTAKKFNSRTFKIGNLETVVANFMLDDFEVEIFGQSLNIQQQNAYLHLMIEYKILQLKGEDFRKEIIKLKQQGYKTEPAFALLLGLEGNPYQALLDYSIDGEV